MSEMEQTDVVDQVRAAVGETAVVKSSMGGLEITVQDDDRFPWTAVMRALTSVGQDVWVVRRSGVFVIRSKPPAV